MRWQKFRQICKYCVIFIYIGLWCFALLNYSSRCQESVPEVFSSSALLQTLGNDSNIVDSIPLDKEYCHLDKNKLQLKKVDVINAPEMSNLISRYHNNKPDGLKTGGFWSPKDCIPYQTVAIVIAYRKRYFHLRILLDRLHSLLRLQKISYRIFLIEQAGEELFNRGMLMNVGVVEALNLHAYDCFIFHDVDLIPEHNQNIYLCDNQARHLVSAMDEMRFNVMYYNYIGGVLALSRKSVMKTNGFSNVYWGWGSEDDDISARTAAVGLLITRPPRAIGRYKMIRHIKSSRSDNGYGYFFQWRGRQFKDGINAISRDSYHVVHRDLHYLYTNITVILNKRRHEMKKDWLSYKSESSFWFLSFFYP